MAKKAKKARKKAISKPEVEPFVITGPDIELTEVTEVTVSSPKPVIPPKPTTGQCANCGGIRPFEELFKCNHCGKTGCKGCGWDKEKFEVCPNCATPVPK